MPELPSLTDEQVDAALRKFGRVPCDADRELYVLAHIDGRELGGDAERKRYAKLVELASKLEDAIGGGNNARDAADRRQLREELRTTLAAIRNDA
jgi:hypothetical protein